VRAPVAASIAGQRAPAQARCSRCTDQGDDVSITTINMMDGHNVMASGQRQHHLVEMHGHGVVPQALGVERAAAGQREPRCAR
jgi:hypothetical protein